MLYFTYLLLCLRLDLFMFYSCDLFFHYFHFHYNNHKTSLTQKNLFFGHVCQKFSLRVLLKFCLRFYQFQPGVAYKSVAYKKSVYLIHMPREETVVNVIKVLYISDGCCTESNIYFFILYLF